MNTYVCINMNSMHVYMSICILHICMYILICMFVLMWNDVYMFTWVYVSMWMHMCMHVWNVCCVCINMYVYVSEYVHLHSDCHMSTSLYPAPPGPRPRSHPQHFRQWSLSCPFPRDRDLRGLCHPLMDTPASAGSIWLVELGLAAPPTEEPTAGPLTPHTPTHSPSHWSLLCSTQPPPATFQTLYI